MCIEGLKIAAAHSFGCENMFHFEAFPNFADDSCLIDFLNDLDLENGKITNLLKKLWPYNSYHRIAREMGISDCFDKTVVRAYWFCAEEFKDICHNAIILKKIIEVYKRNRGMGGKILSESSLNSFLICLVAPGKVLKIENDSHVEAMVETVSFRKNGFWFGSAKRIVKNKTLKSLKKGDRVSVHGMAVRWKISIDEAASIMTRTEEILNDCLNGLYCERFGLII